MKFHMADWFTLNKGHGTGNVIDRVVCWGVYCVWVGERCRKGIGDGRLGMCV